MTTKTMIFQPLERVCRIDRQESVLQVAIENGVDLPHSCGGMGSCTTCRVIVTSDLAALPPRTEIESELAEMRGFRDEERLACQLQPFAGLCVRVPGLSTGNT